MIELYTAATPNGWIASIALEELGLPYIVRPVAPKRLELGNNAEEFIKGAQKMLT